MDYIYTNTRLSVVSVPFSCSAKVEVTLPTEVSSVISVVLIASRRPIGTESLVWELINGSVSQFMPSIHFIDSAPIFRMRLCTKTDFYYRSI